MKPNLKPFNLQAALEGKPVVCSNGMKVLELHQSKHHSDSIIVVLDHESFYNPLWYRNDGIIINDQMLSSNTEESLRLFMAPVEHVRYAELTTGEIKNNFIGAVLYTSLDDLPPTSIIAKVTWTE